VEYSVMDSHNNTTTATRAVVITDGRYYIDPDDDIIIGARDFVIASADVDGSENQARNLSYAEAFDIEGKPLVVNWVERPSGYSAHAPASTYPIVWTTPGHTTTKAAVARVVDADVIDSGDKDSSYALLANHFSVSDEDAQRILNGGQAAFIDAASVEVVKLVASKPTLAPVLVSTAGFAAREGVYEPITFRIETIPAASQSVGVKGSVWSEPIIELKRYRVAFDPNGGTLTGPSAIYIVEPATSLSYLPISPVRSGYEFLFWGMDRNATSMLTTSTMISEDVTVYAQWRALPVPEIPPVQPPPTIIINPPQIIVPPSTSGPVYVTVYPTPAPTPTPAPEPAPTPVPEPEAPRAQEPTPVPEPPTPPAQVEQEEPAPFSLRLDTWSLFNLCAVVLSGLLVALFALSYFFTRRKPEEHVEEPIDQRDWDIMTPEARVAFLLNRENSRQAAVEKSAKPRRSKRGISLNLPLLLIAAIVFVEVLIVLLVTQDFAGPMVATDQYSIPLSLAVCAQAVLPMIGGIAKRGSDG
ncbi:MAG: InlB B-repeat-containing protein, partial [Coriobacteriaceae bacterium]|nr:InlB B-repeat-containing protein [Coriobacteriaceae bacterium]